MLFMLMEKSTCFNGTMCMWTYDMTITKREWMCAWNPLGVFGHHQHRILIWMAMRNSDKHNHICWHQIGNKLVCNWFQFDDCVEEKNLLNLWRVNFQSKNNTTIFHPKLWEKFCLVTTTQSPNKKKNRSLNRCFRVNV